MKNNTALLFNDTRIEANPGCQATVDNLILFIRNSQKLDLRTFDVGSNYAEFLNANFSKDVSQKLFCRIINKFFPFLSRFSNRRRNTFDFDKWKDTYQNYLLLDIRKAISDSQLIFINMEGTIHHNSVSGIVLLSIAQYAISKNKKVFLVNGTIQDMNKDLLRSVLENSYFVSVREKNSYDYLSKIVVTNNVHLIPDFAFKSNVRSIKKNLDNYDDNIFSNKLKCIYSLGVNFVNREYNEAEEIIRNNVKCIRNGGYKLDILLVESREKKFLNLLMELKVNVIDFTFRKSYKSIGFLFDNYDLCLTGRYHIGIFGIMSDCKTFFLPSNSYKSQGLLKMINMEQYYIDHELLNEKLVCEFKDNKLQKFVMPLTLENSFADLRIAIQDALK